MTGGLFPPILLPRGRAFPASTAGLLLALWLAFSAFTSVARAQRSDSDAAQKGSTAGVDPDPPAADESTQSMFPHFSSSRVWLSGQANFISQANPDFPALYSGPHSLINRYEKATSRVLTLYTGLRLNNSIDRKSVV